MVLEQIVERGRLFLSEAGSAKAIRGPPYLHDPAHCSYFDAGKRRRVMLDSRAVSVMIFSLAGGVHRLVCNDPFVK